MDSLSSQIVADFYEASLDSARWPQALLTLGEWARADAAAIGFHNFETGNGYLERAIGIGADLQSAYRRVQARSNIWLHAEAPFRKSPEVIRGLDLIDEATLRASPFYRNWLKAAGLLHALFVVLERSGDSITFVLLMRREGKADFPPEVFEPVRQVAPALARALRVGPGIRRLRALGRAALRAIDAMPIGVAVLDSGGAVMEANRTARAIIDAGEGVVIANGGLVTDIGGRRVRLRDLLGRDPTGRNGLQPEEPILLPVPRASGQRPLTLLLMPLEEPVESGMSLAGVPTVPSALLFIGDPERSVRFDQARIARLYGLSRAESRVAALLASGYRLEQVAEALDIAYETVRKHLKQIFGKTGTYRQAELVRMLVTGPAGLAI